MTEQSVMPGEQMSGEQAVLNADGSRLHLHYGPIDLIISVDGSDHARLGAFDAAVRRFDGLLDELVEELSALRRSIQSQPPVLNGSVAKRMVAAAWPYRNQAPVTPMAAVAGAVADEIGAAIAESGQQDQNGPRELTRWMINNGGDIAIWLAEGQSYRVGVVMDQSSLLAPAEPRITCSAGARTRSYPGPSNVALTVTSEMGIGGIATSGQQGRSFSLGIADSVTVLATNAAAADVAATLIANRVDLPDHPGIMRTPADKLDPHSDLGQRLVTIHVPHLSQAETTEALTAGLAYANRLVAEGLIATAILHLSGITVSTSAALTPVLANSGQQAAPHHPGATIVDA